MPCAARAWHRRQWRAGSRCCITSRPWPLCVTTWQVGSGAWLAGWLAGFGVDILHTVTVIHLGGRLALRSGLPRVPAALRHHSLDLPQLLLPSPLPLFSQPRCIRLRTQRSLPRQRRPLPPAVTCSKRSARRQGRQQQGTAARRRRRRSGRCRRQWKECRRRTASWRRRWAVAGRQQTGQRRLDYTHMRTSSQSM